MVVLSCIMNETGIKVQRKPLRELQRETVRETGRVTGGETERERERGREGEREHGGRLSGSREEWTIPCERHVDDGSSIPSTTWL